MSDQMLSRESKSKKAKNKTNTPSKKKKTTEINKKKTLCDIPFKSLFLLQIPKGMNRHLAKEKSHYVFVKLMYLMYVDPQPIPGEKQTKPSRNHALLGLSDSCSSTSLGKVTRCLSAGRVFLAKMVAAHLVSFLVLLQQHTLSLFRDKSLNMLQSLRCLPGGL